MFWGQASRIGLFTRWTPCGDGHSRSVLLSLWVAPCSSHPGETSRWRESRVWMGLSCLAAISVLNAGRTEWRIIQHSVPENQDGAKMATVVLRATRDVWLAGWGWTVQSRLRRTGLDSGSGCRADRKCRILHVHKEGCYFHCPVSSG